MNVVGLMTGTSLDGITAALVELRDRDAAGTTLDVRLIAYKTWPYPPELRAELRRVAEGEEGAGSPRELCCLHARLGEALAEAALAVIAEAGLRPDDVELIGSHGQTVAHLPQGLEGYAFSTPSTLQLGDPGVIAARTGLDTVGDFRPPDLALGGQGAPLMPYVDWLLFRHPERARALVNVGGIANATLVPRAARPGEVRASDVGPGNMLIDGVVRALTQGERLYDEDGAWAARGRVCPELLEELLQHPFFARPFPKSTGREEFGEALARRVLQRAEALGLPPEDVVATVTALTVEGIARGLEALALTLDTRGDPDDPNPPPEVLVSGGGVRNRTLMARLRARLEPQGVRVAPTDAYGLPAEAKEAVGFAVLAYQAVHGRVNHLPRTTGAARSLVLGKLCRGWRRRGP